MDIRTEKTKRSIYNAFISIRAKKDIEKITVKELCTAAQINKSTFYVYYRDIFDLSDKIECEIVENVIKNIDHPENAVLAPAEFVRSLSNAYSSQSALIGIVFSGSRSENLPNRIEAALKDIIFSGYPEYADSPEKCVFITYSVYGGYYAYNKNLEYGENRVVEAIGKLSESLIHENSKKDF